MTFFQLVKENLSGKDRFTFFNVHIVSKIKKNLVG